jgi:hypothetical protein
MSKSRHNTLPNQSRFRFCHFKSKSNLPTASSDEGFRLESSSKMHRSTSRNSSRVIPLTCFKKDSNSTSDTLVSSAVWTCLYKSFPLLQYLAPTLLYSSSLPSQILSRNYTCVQLTAKTAESGYERLNNEAKREKNRHSANKPLSSHHS